MAMPAASRTASQTTPARPSISPLSTASKKLNSSPIATRDATMQDVEAQLNSEMGMEAADNDADLGDGQDDRSSSLSDPEDDNDDMDGLNGVADNITEEEQSGARRDLEVDSEAETERLDQTPQKLRKHADALGRTPSKLSQAATAEDDLSDPPSPLPAGPGAASSTSTVATAGQKRKRSEDDGDSPLTSAESDIGESPRKRSHEITADTPAHNFDDAAARLERAEEREGTPAADGAVAKGGKGRKGRPKGKKHEQANAQPTADAAEPEEEQAIEDNQPKTEEDLAAKKEATTLYDDVAKQFRAFRERLTNERLAVLTSELHLLSQPECEYPEYLRQVACVDARLNKQISEAHAYYNYRMRSLRDRVLGDRAQLHSQHFQTVRELRDDVLDQLGEDWYAIQKERRSGDEAADERYIYKFPKKRSDHVKQQAKYNQEVSILSGMAKYVGFPAAPDLAGADVRAWEEDARAMKVTIRTRNHSAGDSLLTSLQLSKRGAQPTHAPQQHQQHPPQQPTYLAGPTVPAFAPDERLAHEQFYEQNAWARPQAPIHQSHAHPLGSGVGTPGISHTPDWAADPNPTARNLMHNLYQRNQVSSPLATPARHSGGGDGADALPSSVMAQPPTATSAIADRMNLLSQLSRANGGDREPPSSSPLTAIPRPKYDGDLTGFRNISGISAISGASTIDAPPEADNNHHYRHDEAPKHPLPHLIAQPSAPQQVFDTSQLHRHPAESGREVYSSAGFRPKEGAFGTPTPAPLMPSGGREGNGAS
ncbi:uncharacterized protein LTR77_001540 [Saxophila tyrrhenica]|uniref:Uncharacterized protein n=1 Tax=Saxophila tyrrhenica TaxID=1690608 RepID=A0AAV9PKL2_9PEZI|nr:hypothetical protein LTR77_001540 [Saxophila tyrrhenica]